MLKLQLKALAVLFFCVFQYGHIFAAASSEEFEFQAEVGRLMDILINSLYTHKEIFLRELISNASDALDKLRFLAVSNPEILGDIKDLEIRIEFNSDEKILTITDTGIGMTKNDLIQNLGTIAKTGTTQFIEAIKGGNLNIIGQFGVGFYSSFLVSQKVQVISKHNDDDQYIWESSATNSFTVVKDPEGNTLGRGTKINLFLKQDATEFVEEKTLKELIKKYSEFINFPIKLKIFKEITKEVEVEDEEEEAKKDGETQEKKPEDDLEVKDDEEPKEKKKKTEKVKETVTEWIVVNDNKAIWTRAKEDIEDDEYKKFYKSLTKDYDDPLSWIHFKAEGEVEFTSLLFIPKKAPHDLFDNYYSKSAALKLYVRRVLINDNFEDLIPRYLAFIKGVVDSDDLPINVSRESIQQLKMLKVIGRKLVRKALEMIKKLAEDEEDDEDEDEDDDEGKESSSSEESQQEDDKKNKDEKEDSDEEDEDIKAKRIQAKKDKYRDFWKEFGKNLKLGIIEDSANRQKLAKLSRWYSSRNITELTSFDDYISRMKSGQESIYVIAGENKEALMNHPTLQKLLKKGYEVLLLDDPIDEFVFQHLTEYEKKKFDNVGKGDFKLPEEDENERKRIKKLKKMFKPLTDWWKKLLPSELENVQISQRLVDDPCLVVSTEYGYSANMERISKAQAYANQDRSNPYQNQKKILEINPSHPIIKDLLERVKDESDDKETEDLAKVLYEGALINSGYSVKDPNLFAKRFFKLFHGALGIPKDAAVEDIEIDLEDSEDEDVTKEGDKQNEDVDDLDNQNNDDDDDDDKQKDNRKDDL